MRRFFGSCGAVSLMAGFGLSVVAASAAQAGNDDLDAIDNGVGVNASVNQLQYKESSGGFSLDKENGWFPGGGVEINKLVNIGGPLPLDDIYLHFDGGAASGTTHYNGALQNGTPLQSTTNTTTLDFNGRLGKAFAISLDGQHSTDMMLTPYIEVGYHRWDRELKGSAGYNETYDNYQTSLGVLGQFSPIDRWVVSATMSLGTTWDGNVSTNLAGVGNFSLGNHAIAKGSLGVDYRITDRWSVNSKATVQYFGYGKSPVNSSGFYEPDSTTDLYGFQIGAGFAF